MKMLDGNVFAYSNATHLVLDRQLLRVQLKVNLMWLHMLSW